MPDKQLLRLLGEDKRYIYRAVAWMLTGSLGSIGFTACLCYGLHLLLADAKASLYLLPFAFGTVCAAVRFLATIRAAAVRDRLGRSVKKSLRAQLYAKLLRLGVRETKNVKMAGLTQLATEGIEQLDLYYSAYLPQFFYAMLSPLLLFGICVFLNWRVAAELLLNTRLTEEIKSHARNLLKELGLYKYRDAHPSTLSGGQKQRLAIACAIFSGRRILILDEPTSGLDGRNMRLIAERLKSEARNGRTILVITHDRELIESCCDNIVEVEKRSP